MFNIILSILIIIFLQVFFTSYTCMIHDLTCMTSAFYDACVTLINLHADDCNMSSHCFANYYVNVQIITSSRIKVVKSLL